MRDRRAPHGTHRDRGFEAFVAGAAGRLLHTATLLTAEDPQHNPRACHLLTLALADTYAGWDRLRGDDPYDRTRQYLAGRFAREAWHRYGRLSRTRRRPPGVLGALAPHERLVLVLRLHEGVAEEQTAALLGLPAERVRVLCDRAVSRLTHPARRPATAVDGPGAGAGGSGAVAGGSGAVAS
ncbi:MULTISPECIES: sigma factor-like helix-turn-helix DNA-binding protein [Streptomyces]|uniref:sigma factor-like helix-turn-helix DNA-binding protein n=1 Tax=Streptomyces TaxID=1883 RepID=UPI0035715BF5